MNIALNNSQHYRVIVVSFFTQIEDVALQLSHNLAYLDLESTLEEQHDELEGFRDRYSNAYIDLFP